jgi:predicted ATPase/DNA-binding XRE family transcriptional regulator
MRRGREGSKLIGDGLAFGDLLRRHRGKAGLSQEALAERAGLSLRGLSDLERGARRAPYRDTVLRLAEALGLGEPERQELLASRRRLSVCPGAPPAEPTRAALPVYLTSFVGREREVAEVRRLLATTRLMTLTGAGGVGKTRLALQAATELVGSYRDGVWLVELAPLADAALVPQTVATAVGVREQPGRPLQQTLTDALRPRRLLLVLDNCEHLVMACAELAEALLRACPHLRLLATSREVLRIAGETAWRVPPLGLPPLMPARPSAPVLLEQVQESEAVRLFIARAAAALPSFVLTDGNAPTVARICHQLDGLPLAIELAAARVSALGLEQLATRLDDRFRLLTGGSRSALPRQQTLRATLEWSYDLLAETELRLFDRLSVFEGGWSLEAAEAVGAGDGVDPGAVLDLLGQLVAKSLVVADPGPEGTVRYRLLETVRAYGREKLHEAGEEAALGRRHLAYYLTLAERAEPELTGADQGVWLGRLEQERDNLRAALQWTIERGEAELGLRLAGAVWRLWWVRGDLSEGRRWLAALVAVAGRGGAELAAPRAKALGGAAVLAREQGEYGECAALSEASLALSRAVGDKRVSAWNLAGLGMIATLHGDYSRAAGLSEESLALSRAVGDKRVSAIALTVLGILARDQGDYSRATALLEESQALFRELGDQRNSAWALNILGIVARDQGDYSRAAAVAEESLALSRAVGDKRVSAYSLSTLGSVVRHQADYGRASALLKESLALSRDHGQKRHTALGMEELAAVACAEEQPERAARLFGAAKRLRDALGTPLPPVDRAAYERSVAAARVQLGTDAFAAAWAEGQALPLEQAVDYALQVGANKVTNRMGRAATARAHRLRQAAAGGSGWRVG